jgi:hypothetical protein
MAETDSNASTQSTDVDRRDSTQYDGTRALLDAVERERSRALKRLAEARGAACGLTGNECLCGACNRGSAPLSVIVTIINLREHPFFWRSRKATKGDCFPCRGSLKASIACRLQNRTCPQREVVHRLRFKFLNFSFRQKSIWRISGLRREMRPNGRLSGTKVASRYD